MHRSIHYLHTPSAPTAAPQLCTATVLRQHHQPSVVHILTPSLLSWHHATFTHNATTAPDFWQPANRLPHPPACLRGASGHPSTTLHSVPYFCTLLLQLLLQHGIPPSSSASSDQDLSSSDSATQVHALYTADPTLPMLANVHMALHPPESVLADMACPPTPYARSTA